MRKGLLRLGAWAGMTAVVAVLTWGHVQAAEGPPHSHRPALLKK